MTAAPAIDRIERFTVVSNGRAAPDLREAYGAIAMTVLRSPPALAKP